MTQFCDVTQVEIEIFLGAKNVSLLFNK